MEVHFLLRTVPFRRIASWFSLGVPDYRRLYYPSGYSGHLSVVSLVVVTVIHGCYRHLVDRRQGCWSTSSALVSFVQ